MCNQRSLIRVDICPTEGSGNLGFKRKTGEKQEKVQTHESKTRKLGEHQETILSFFFSQIFPVLTFNL